MVTYPTDPLSRVNSITRTFFSGQGGKATYQMEIMTGGLNSVFLPAIRSREIASSIPAEPSRHPTLSELTPEQLGFTRTDYVEWVNKMQPWYLQKIYGHIPTFEEWYQIMISQILSGQR